MMSKTTYPAASCPTSDDASLSARSLRSGMVRDDEVLTVIPSARTTRLVKPREKGRGEEGRGVDGHQDS